MGLARQLKRLRRKIEGTLSPKKPRKVLLEPLEPRLLLDADLSFAMADNVNDLTLRLGEIEGVDTVLLINNLDSDRIVAERALADTSTVEIIGTGQGDTLYLDVDFDALLESLSITLGGGDDTLHIRTLGPFAADLTVENSNGFDTVYIDGNLELPGHNLEINAEKIIAGVVLGEQSDVSDWDPGATYSTCSPVLISGSGSGMTADINVDSAGTPHVLVTGKGSGYNIGDTVAFACPAGGNGTPITLTVLGTGELGLSISTLDRDSAGNILMAGDIVLQAEDAALRQELEISPLDLWNRNEAAVIISGATIEGGNISITASAEDGNLYDDYGAYGDKAMESLFALLDQIPGLAISSVLGVSGQAVVRHAEATVSVAGSEIAATGDVEVGSSADSDASLHTVSINGVATSGRFTLSVGYGEARSKATTTIDRTTIVADGSVDITSGATTKASVKSRTSSNMLTATNPDNYSLAVAIANTREDAHTAVLEGSSITSLNEGVLVSAVGGVTNFAWSQPTVNIDGTVAVAFALDFDEADIRTLVDGHIDAAYGAGNTFDARDGGNVDYVANTIRMLNHGFEDGEQVTYSHGLTDALLGEAEPPDIGGLEDGKVYYVQVIDKDTIRLANAPTIDLDYALDPGYDPVHTLGLLKLIHFESTDVDPAEGKIGFAQPHGLQGGEALRYLGAFSSLDETGSEQNQGVGGLEKGRIYYAVTIDAYTISLAESPGGSALGFTGGGVGQHAFACQSAPEGFAPKTAVNGDRNTVTFAGGHGFQTGDAVIYHTDPAATYRKPLPPVSFDQGLGVVNGMTLTVPKDQRMLVAPGDKAILVVDGATVDATVESATYDPDNDVTGVVLDQGVLTGSLSRAAFDGSLMVDEIDAPVEGLADGSVYYVVNVDDHTIRLTSSKGAALNAAAVDLEPADDLTGVGLGDTHTLKTSSSPDGITIYAGLEATNAIFAAAKITDDKPSWTSALTTGGDWTLTQLEEWIHATVQLGKQVLNKQPENSPVQAGAEFGIAGAIAINYADHEVETLIGPTARLASSKDIDVSAEISQASQVASTAGASKPADEEAEASVAVALGLGIFNNSAKAVVNSGAELDANRAITVSGSVDYGFLISNPLTAINPLDYLKTTGPEGWAYFMDGTLGFSSNLFNTYVMTTAAQGKVAGGGSFAINAYDNTSEARIREGARINHDDDSRFRTGDQTVAVTAATDMNLIGVAGVAGLSLNLDGVMKGGKEVKNAIGGKDKILNGLKQLVNPFGAEGGEGGIGASFLVEVIDNTTEAVIEGGALVHAGALTVDAQTTMFDFALAEAGGKASSFAVAGAVSVGVVNNKTKAYIGSGAVIESEGAITISAGDDLTRIGITGGVVAGANTGVGVSVSVNVVDRDTQAFIGTALDQAVGAGGTNITAAGPIALEATSTGALWTASVAAAVTGTPPTEKEIAENERVKNAPSKAQELLGETGKTYELKTGVGVAGDVSVNVVDEKTHAYVNDQGSIATEGILDLTSTNDSAVWSLAGSVAISLKGEKTSLGIAGSISANVIESETKTFVSGTTIDTASLSLLSDRKGGIRSLTAAGSGAPLKEGIAVAGSISVNVLNEKVEAYLSGVTATLDEDATIKAQNDCQIWAIGGALAYGGKGGIGVGVAVNVMGTEDDPNVTRAYIDTSTVTMANGTLEVSACNENPTMDSRIIAGTGSVGIGSGSESFAGAGTISVNLICNDTEAYIKNSTIGEPEDDAGTLNVLVEARDNSGILAISGAVGAAQKASIGAAVGYNEIDNHIDAYLDGATLTLSGTLTIEASSESEIEAYTIGVAAAAGSGKFAGAGSVSVNMIKNTTEAAIENGSTVQTPGVGSVTLTAADTSKIGADGGGVGITYASGGENSGTSFAVGISIAINDIGNNTYALIDDSTVTSNGNIALTAASAPTIEALSIGGAVAVGSSNEKTGFGFSGAGAGSGNTIRNTIEAAIRNGSSVTTTGTGAVMVKAMDLSTIVADAGGVSVAVGASSQGTGAALSVGVSIADNLVENHTKATIDGSTVTAAGNIELTAVSAAKIDALTIAGAVGVGASATKGGYAAAGAGAASYNDIRNTVEAYVKNAPSIQSTGGSLKVTATDGLLLFETPDPLPIPYGSDGQLPAAWRTVFAAQSITLSNDVTVSLRAEGREWLVKDNDKGETYLIKMEQDTYRVLKPSIITADGGGVAIAVGATAGQKAAGGLSIGVSTADNTINNTIRAFVDNSALPNPGNTSVSAAGDITLSATSMAEIDSLTIGGGIAVGASGGGAGFAGAAGGAAAYNKIQNTIESFMKGVGTITSANGNLTLTATDSAAILADAVGASIAVGASGASYGGALSIGVSIAENTISNETRAYIDNSGLPDSEKTIELNAGNVSIFATSMDTIDALSIAASISVGAGSKAGIALSGGGSESTNVILTKTNAYIQNTVLESTGDVFLAATNMSDIDAVVITASVSAGFGGKAGVAASVGASLARNLIGWDEDDVQIPAQVQAFVKDSAIDTDGDLTLCAAANETVEAVVAAGSMAISGGGTGGVGLAGSGADAENKISTQVKAFIDGDGDTGIFADSISLTALDLSSIKADVGAGSLAASFAGTAAVSLSIGVSLAENTIQNDVEAYIANADSVTATDGSITLRAWESSVIDALSVAASLAASFGNVGVALSGAGATVDNKVENTIRAYISDSTVTTSPSVFDYIQEDTPDEIAGGERVRLDGGDIYEYVGATPLAGPIDLEAQTYTDAELWRPVQNDIIVDALSVSTVTAMVGGVAAAISGGQVAASGSIGVALLDNLILNQVTASIQDSSVWSSDDILVQAKATDTVDAVGFSGSVAIAAGIGGAGAGCGVEVTNTLTSGVSAYVQDSIVTAEDDIAVKALSGSHIVKSQAIGVAVAASLGSASVAVSLADNDIGNTVQAYVAGSAGNNIDAGGDVSILADVERARMSDVGAVTASVTAGVVGLSGGGIDIDNTIVNTVNAYISGPFNVTADGDVSIVASEDAYIVGDATAVSVSVSLGAGLGVALVENQIESTIQAWVQEATVTSDNTLIRADSVADVAKTVSCGVSGSAILGAQGNEATANIKTLVRAFAENATLISDHDVVIQATSNITANTNAKGGAFGAIAVGAMVSDVNLGRGHDVYEVEAAAGMGTTIQAGSLRITAASSDDLLAESTAGGGGAVAAAGAESEVKSDQATMARIGSGARIEAGGLAMNSTHSQDIDASADSYAIAAAAGSGAGVGNTIATKANVDIGSGATVNAGNIIITAKNQLTKDDYKDSSNLRSGSASLGNVTVLLSETDIGEAFHPFEAVVTIGNGAKLTVAGDNQNPGVLKIEALNKITAIDSVRIESVSGFGISTGISRVDSNTLAAINVEGAVLESKAGDVYLTAKTDSTVSTSSNLLVATALSGGAGAEATGITKATNQININNGTVKGSDVHLYAGRDGSEVPNLINTFANVELTAMSMLPNIAVPIPTADITEINAVNVLGDSSIRALEDVNLVTDPGIVFRRTDGLALSLSLIPYGFPIPGYGSATSTNLVNIGEDASIEAGINNQAVVLIKPVTLMGEQSIDPARLEGTQAERLLTDAEKLAEGLSSDVQYEYCALNAERIAFTVYEGTVIQIAEDGEGNPVAGNGETGAYYLYRIESSEPARIILNQEDFTNAKNWEKLIIAYDLDTLAAGTLVAIQKGQIVKTAEGELYQYLGESVGSPTVDLTLEDYTDVEKWGQIGPYIYGSDVTLSFQDALRNKFYVIKPARVEAPTLSLQNVGAILLAQRREILDWIANHSSNPEAVARYEIELALVEETLAELGLMDVYEDTDTGETVQVANEGLDVLFVEVPDIYASPGSIFIKADDVSRAVFVPLVDNQLVARAGAEISVFNESPFSMTVSDMVISDTKRVAVVDGEYTVLSPGNVYFNNRGLTAVQDAGAKTISITQDSVSRNPEDYDLDLEIPGEIGQDVFVIGDVVNEVGDVFLTNNEGSINVSGELRAENVNIDAAKDFNLNTEDWFHVMDPRQYPGLDAYRGQVYNEAGTSNTATYDENPFTDDIDPWGAVLAQGRIAVTARYLNINGVIQSGVQTITLYVDDSFAPEGTGSFLDDDGNPVEGISFGPDGVPVDGYFDAQKQAIVVDEIVPQGGRIELAGQILSTGNGMLRVAHGYTSVDIQNDSPYDLILNRIDTTTLRDGLITITDTARLQKVVYEVDGEQIKETVYQGTFSEDDPDGDGSRIDYEEVGSGTHDLSEIMIYETREGLYYAWTEGQEKSRVVERYYAKKSFNLLGFDWDDLGKDSSYVWEKTNFRDEYPLLESEILAVEPSHVEDEASPEQLVTIETGQTVKTAAGTVYMYQGNTEEIDLVTADFTDIAKWVEAVEVPGYAEDQAYTIQYEMRKDTDVELYQNISIIKVVADKNGVRLAQGGVVGHRYLYVGENSELVLRDQNYSDETQWADVTASSVDAQVTYESGFLNYSFEVITWTTGGGWLRYKTVHMLTTQIFGEKDYYTHTLEAGCDVGVQFLQGPADPSINVDTAQDLYVQGTITSPGEGSVSLAATGSVIFMDTAAVLGVSPSIEAGDSVRVNVEGGIEPVTEGVMMGRQALGEPEALNVETAGDIDIRVVFNPEGNQSSTIIVGRVVSASGNVVLHAGDGIRAAGEDSLVSGNLVELYTKVGDIGSEALPLQVDSDVLGSGGVAAWASGNIFIREVTGDLKLSQPRSWEDVQASVYSETGDVVLEAAEGAILDAFYEEFRARTQGEAEALDQKLQLTGEQARAAAEASIRAEENTQTQLYHTYWETYRNAQPDEVEREMVVEIIDAEQNTITFGEAHGLDTGDQVFFSVGVDLRSEDYADTEQWARIVPDYDLETVQGTVTLETEQIVRTVDGELFLYFGENEEGVDLTVEDFEDAGRWAEIAPEYDLETLAPEARVMLRVEQMVRTSDGSIYRYQGESVHMPYSNLENNAAYYAIVIDGTTIKLALSRYDAAISESAVVLDIMIEGGDDVVLHEDEGDFRYVDLLEFSYTYGDLWIEGADEPEDPSSLDERYQGVHYTYGSGAYDPNFIYRVSEQERQERIESRTFSEGALRYQISESLFNYLYPDAEGGGGGAPAEMPNIIANHVTLNSYGEAGQIGRVTGIVVIDLSGGFENLPEGHQEILSYAGVEDVIDVTYAPDDPSQIQTLILQVWNDLNVEASGGVSVNAGAGIALQTEGDLAVDSIEAGGNVRLVAGGSVIDSYTGASTEAIRTSGDLILVSENEGIGTAEQWVRVDLQAADPWNTPTLTARAAEDIFIAEQQGPMHVHLAEAVSGDVELLVRDSLGSGDDLVIEGDGVIKAGGSVALLAGDGLRIETGGMVEAGSQVLIHGDYGNGDPGVGCVLDIGGGIFGTSIEIRGDVDDDTINVGFLAEGMPMTILAGGGENTITAGRLSTWTGGLVDGISGVLIVNGEEGTDTLNIDDSGDGNDNQGTLNGETLTGLGMGGKILFSRVAVVNVLLGSGMDVLHVEGSNAESVINVSLGGGDDTMKLFGGQFITGVVDGEAGTDSMDYRLWSTGIAVDLLGAAATGVGGVRSVENVLGGSGADRLAGDDGPNVLIGNGGDDYLVGNGGDDILVGGAGDDGLEGGEGNDTYVFSGGTLGKDTVFEAGDRNRDGQPNDPHDLLDFSDFAGPVVVSLNRRNPQVLGSDLVLTLTNFTGVEDVIGNNFGNRITGNSRGNTLTGGDGDDWMHGGSGKDILYGGGGNDHLFGEDGDDSLYGGAGDDHLDGGTGNDTLHGGEGRDLLYGNRGDDLLAGGRGDDRVAGGAGKDLLFFPEAFEGVELLVTEGGFGWSTDGLGDTDELLGGVDGAIGTAFNDTMTGDDGPNEFWGMGGDDTIDARGGDDLIVDGEGNNTLIAGWGDDTVLWTEGDGEDTVDMGEGRDSLHLTTRDEDHVITLMSPESGMVRIEETRWALSVSGGERFEIRLGAGNDVLAYEDLTGAGAEDLLLYLGAGDDRVDGSQATLPVKAYGEAGNDVFAGGPRRDFFDGGDGMDGIDYSSAPGPVTVNMSGWTYRDGRGSWDSFDSIENLIGTPFDDVIWGTNADNTILALEGNDRVWAMGGHDSVFGGGGDDWLYGGAGNDLLNGGPGDDRLYGNAGDDILNGDEGNDRLYGGLGEDLLGGGEGNDMIEGGGGKDLVFFPEALSGIAVTLEGEGRGWSTDGLGGLDKLLSGIDGAIGTEFGDDFTGDQGDNEFHGMRGEDVIDAGSGDDIVVWSEGDGQDSVNLGEGRDRIVLTTGEADDIIRLTRSERGQVVVEGWSLPDLDADVFEIRTGGGNDEVVIGDLAGAGVEEVLVRLGSGDDIVDGTQSTVPITAYGDAGNDVFAGGSGRDSFDGGEGLDWVDYSAAPGPVKADLRGWVSQDGRGNWDFLKNVENLRGSSFDDEIWGTGGENEIEALEGNDNVWAGKGDDRVWGGEGDDILYGGSGDDRLWGEGGDDELDGGEGNDILDGGEGENKLISGNETLGFTSVGQESSWLTDFLLEGGEYNPFEPKDDIQIMIEDED